MSVNQYKSILKASVPKNSKFAIPKLMLARLIRCLINFGMLPVILILIFCLTPILMIPLALLGPGTTMFFVVVPFAAVVLSCWLIINGIHNGEQKRHAEKSVVSCPECHRLNSIRTRKCPRCEAILESGTAKL